MLLGDTTGTDIPARNRGGNQDESGIWWVAPEERFDRLCSGLRVGRSASNEVCLEGNKVSREHARIDKDGPLWLLRDLQSKNGVWINGRKRDVVALDPQDTIRIGDWVGVVCSAPRSCLDDKQLFRSLSQELLLSVPTLARLGSLDDLSKREIPVAIYGETGTGKEGIATAIHRKSQRTGPLIAVNCATILETMADALLFGHRRGAFTGAHEASQGFVQAAHGGTLFLDEISELPLVVQAKLLRVLENRRVTPLGCTTPEFVDFRLVVACQASLSNNVAERTFRSDLYARIRGVELYLPPLRERRQEVVRLFSRFISDECGQVPALDSHLIEALCAHDWPYNVRDLKQLAFLLGMSRKARLSLQDLPERFRLGIAASNGCEPGGPKSRRTAWLQRHAHELARLELALANHDGNVSRAATEAQIPRHRARRLLAAAAAAKERLNVRNR